MSARLIAAAVALALLGGCGQGDRHLPETPAIAPDDAAVERASERANDVGETQIYWTAVFDYKIGQRHQNGFSHITETVGPQISEVRCQIRRAEHIEDLKTDLAYDVLSKCVRADKMGKPL
ncbi:MAG: hypothetical protein ACPGVT_11995 [Maricaulaceae bacterium]